MTQDDESRMLGAPSRRPGRWFDIAKAGSREALRQAIKMVPFVDACREVLEEAGEQAKALEADDFFRRIAEHSSAENVESLAIDIANGLDDPRIYRAVSEGFETMRKTTHEAVRDCIAILVSQQLYDLSMPTEYFRASSRLLENAPVDVLPAVREMIDAWLQIWRPEDREPRLCKAKFSHGALWFASTTTQDQGYVRSIRRDMNEWFRYSDFIACTPRFDRAIALLRDEGFGWDPVGYHEDISVCGLLPERRFLWDPNRAPWAKSLLNCLGPLPRERSVIQFRDEE